MHNLAHADRVRALGCSKQPCVLTLRVLPSNPLRISRQRFRTSVEGCCYITSLNNAAAVRPSERARPAAFAHICSSALIRCQRAEA